MWCSSYRHIDQSEHNTHNLDLSKHRHVTSTYLNILHKSPSHVQSVCAYHWPVQASNNILNWSNIIYTTLTCPTTLICPHPVMLHCIFSSYRDSDLSKLFVVPEKKIKPASLITPYEPAKQSTEPSPTKKTPPKEDPKIKLIPPKPKRKCEQDQLPPDTIHTFPWLQVFFKLSIKLVELFVLHSSTESDLQCIYIKPAADSLLQVVIETWFWVSSMSMSIHVRGCS